MSTVYTNTFTVKKGSDSKPLATPIEFYVLNVNDLELAKEVNKPGEVYAKGEQIIFIITIKNHAEKVTGAKVEDTINNVVSVTQYKINDADPIDYTDNFVEITGLELPAGTTTDPSTTTIRIYGNIK